MPRARGPRCRKAHEALRDGLVEHRVIESAQGVALAAQLGDALGLVRSSRQPRLDLGTARLRQTTVDVGLQVRFGDRQI